MSWFQDLSALTASVQSTVESIEIPKSLPSANAVLESLTLTTPELAAERRQIDEEEKRKVKVRNALAGLLPWETRDAEQDILVEECKEAILRLSQSKETFFGPYEMPELQAKIGDDEKDGEENVEKKNEKPSAASREKLEKLKPLPPLLNDFDFQAHVGLIERILGEDPMLVEMQSKLSGKRFESCVRTNDGDPHFFVLGGGRRERVFWRNYFFHCAFTRYEAGLSLDEIWNEDFELPPKPEGTEESANAEEEVITFDETPTISDEGTDTKPPSEQTDYEIVDTPPDAPRADDNVIDISSAPKQGDDHELASEDYELDELEAEIARELED